MATHSSILAENSMYCIVHGVAKSRTRLSNFHFTFVVVACLVFVFDFFFLGYLPLIPSPTQKRELPNHFAVPTPFCIPISNV